jgi:hypothetical protein
MQRWACLFVFSAVSNDRLDELRTTIEDVEHLFAHPEEIQEYRAKVCEFLLHNRDLWCPEIIYEIFAEHDLFLPADLYPASLMTNVGIDAFPSGKWSKNPTSKLFYCP